MDAPVRHSALLLDLITRPITTTTSIPPLADLISLQSNLEALRSSANKRLRVLDSSRRQVEALRDRDAQRERESSSFDKKKSERTRHDDEREDERKRRERDREREKERDSERERETEKEKDREKERAKRERDKVRRDSEREEIDRERKEAEMQPGRNKLLGGKGKPATSASSSFSASLGGKTAPPGSQPPPFQVKTEAGTSESMPPPPPPSSLPPPTPADPRRSSVAPTSDDSDASSIAISHKKFKKKRKRDLVTSDNEGETPGRRSRDRSDKPASPPAAARAAPKIKLFSSTRATSPLPSPGPPASSNIDFHLPTVTHSLVPPRPPVPPPPRPNPMIQSDMNEDFTNARPGTQTLFATFWQSVEPYVRQVGEEDLAFLKAWKDEDTGPMSIPPLGPHYQLAWDEEDRLTSLNLPIPVLCSTEPVKKGQANKALEYPKMSKTEAVFDTLQMKEDDLVVEDKGAGPLTERVTSAMMAAREVGDAPIGFGGGMGASGSGSGSGSGNGSGGGDPGPSTLGLGDLERGIKRELQLLGLVGEKEIDWSQRADDEISTSLRQTQRLLAEQASLNESRRSVLLSIAKDRLAFAEYQSCLDGLDRVIDSGWAKRQRSAQRTAKQHNKKGKEKEKHDAAGEGKDGGGGKRVMSEGLRKAIERRERFVQHVGGMFQAEEEESPGRFYGLPKESVYKELMDGIEEGS